MGNFVDVRIGNFGEKWLAVLFFPLSFGHLPSNKLKDLGLLPRDVARFADRVGEFQDRGCRCLAVSTDSHYTHLAFAQTPRSLGGLGDDGRLLLVSDLSLDMSRSFGALDEDQGLAFNSIFLLDEARNVVYSQKCDFSIELDLDDAIQMLDDLNKISSE